jgi:general secretion pathway protein N
MRFVAVVVAVLIMGVAMTPATWVDRLASETSNDQLRVGQATGSIWNGRGVLNVMDPVTRQWHPWLRLEWSFQPALLLKGRLAWDLTTDGGTSSHLDLGIAGLRLAELKVKGPARNFWQRVPGPLAKMAWDGDITVTVDVLECSWRRVCSGRLQASWASAASEFLPGQVFGDYLVQANGVAGDFAFNWTSSGDSSVQLSGAGNVSGDGKVRLAGTIKGDPALLTRIPSVASAWVRPTAAVDTWEVHLP